LRLKSAPRRIHMPRSSLAKTFLALAACHWLVDCYGGMWPIFKFLADLDLSRAGLIVTVAVFIGAGLQPLFGLLSDGGGQRRLILFGAALSSLGMLLGPVTFLRDSLSSSAWYGLMFLIMVTTCTGQGMFHPAATSAAGNLHGPRRSVLVALFIASGMFGFSMSQGLFSFVFRTTRAHTEWMLIPAGLILLCGWRWCRPSRRHLAIDHPMRERLADLAAVRRPLTMLFLFEVFMGAMYHGFIFLMPEFLQDSGCPDWMIRGGGYFFWVAGSATLMIPLGHAADRLGGKRMLVGCSAIAILLYYTVVLPQALPWWWYMPLLFLAGGFGGAANPMGVAMGQRLAPQQASVVSGILMGLAWAAASPAMWLAGALAEHPSLGVVKAIWMLGGSGLIALVLAFFVQTEENG